MVFNPKGTETGVYWDRNDKDERLWAAVELFLSTDNKSYHDYIHLHYNDGGLITSAMVWQDVKTLALLTYLKGKSESIDTTIQKQIRQLLVSYCRKLISRVDSNAFHVVLNPGEYNWGSNGQVLNEAVLLILGYDETGNKDFYNAALEQLNYIFGSNASDFSFVTGLGLKHPMHPHHRPSASDGVIAPVPGLLVGGPNQFLQDEVLRSKFNKSTPPATCYLDEEKSYASNETYLNWNAPLVFTSGYFSK